MSKGGNQVQETPQQRALADFALQQLQDYKQRWLPVQRSLGRQIQQMGEPGSAQQKSAEGRAATDSTMQFARAEGALQKTLANRGANVDSSRAKLALTGMGEDKAKTRGLGLTIADQQIEDAYTKGLSALTAIGRGDKAIVATGLADQAAQSARTAQASAETSAMERAGNAQMLGQVGGFGLQQAMGPNVPQAQGLAANDPNGYGINNPYGAGAR